MKQNIVLHATAPCFQLSLMRQVTNCLSDADS